ncbi:unnamed protein product [Victoria cruziana]
MGDKGGESQMKKHSSSSKDPPEEATGGIVVVASEQQVYENPNPNPNPNSNPNPKRVRYGTGQWKPVNPPQPQLQQPPPPPSSPQFQNQPPASSSPATSHHQPQPATADSSSPTPSTPSHSPRPSFSAASDQHHPSKPDHYFQLRKGKYVSPVWKPNEMLWLARAWRVQYSGVGGEVQEGSGEIVPSGRGKSRAEKDKEVAHFLNRHGVNRDAKTAGTKWDNMLGEFRKVYEWERGPEREQAGKSYFRLSPYERKIHRLPASFDEEVYEELSQFMGLRTRASQANRTSSLARGATSTTSEPFRDQLSYKPDMVRTSRDDSSVLRQQAAVGGGETSMAVGLGLQKLAGESQEQGCSGRELRRIGKVRMTWEESVNLWAEEGEYQKGRLRMEGLSFLNAEELTFLDDSMAASSIETFEEGPLKGFSVDRFLCGQQIKVFGRRRSSSGSIERIPPPPPEPFIRSVPPLEYQDRTDYYVGCLRVPTTSTLPSLLELPWHLQEPPPEEFRFPLRREVFRDLPPGKELFFTLSSDLDSRSFVYEILGPLIRPTSQTSITRDSFIPLWDDCINRIISRLCILDVLLIRKPTATTAPSSSSTSETAQDQWPNVTGFVKNLCLWRGEETDQVRDGTPNPSSTILDKLLWTYGDLPYLLGYHAVGHTVTFCALSRSQDRTTRTDLLTVDLSTPSDRMKALVPCWRISNLLPLLVDHCSKHAAAGCFSDYQRLERGRGKVVEIMPTIVKRLFPNRRRWSAVKEIYDFLDHRVPHAEYLCGASESELALVFKPRGCGAKPAIVEQLVEALKFVTKALVALHDMCFMHRDLRWENVRRRVDREEWFIVDFEDAIGSPQIYPHSVSGVSHAPEMSRGVHGVKVDVWGVGHLIRTSGVSVGQHHLLKDLQNRCLEQNPEQRPTAADCYHHLLQLQSSLGGAF